MRQKVGAQKVCQIIIISYSPVILIKLYIIVRQRTTVEKSAISTFQK